MAIQFLNDAKFSRLHKLKFHSTGEITTTGASGTNFDISAIGSNTDLRFLADNDDGSSSVYFLLDASMADYSNPDYYTRFPDNSHLVFGNSANTTALDFEIYHEGTTAYLQGDSNIYMASESNVTIQADNGVELRHGVGGSSRKFQTTTTGVDVTGTINLDNLTINGAQGSDGQVLTSTGSGIAWEDASGGASLSGGAANKLAIWSGTDALTNDTNLHWNTTNDQLGIGNANPQAKLDITQTATAQGIKIRSSSVQPEITFIDGATGDSFAIGHNRSGSRMDIEINGTDTHTFKQNGNVGFGTTNPSEKLHVNGDFLVNNTSGAANGSAHEIARLINTTSGATSSYMYIGASTGNDWRVGKNILGTSGGSNFGIALHSGSTLALEIDGSSNVISNVSSRAPIFYDTNNTTYYVDPASTGISAYFRGDIEIINEQPLLELNDYTATNNTNLNAWVSFQRNGTEAGYVGYGSSSTDYLYLVNFSGRVSINGSFTEHANSSRAPIFYDSNNTSYYTDPASRSNLSTLVVGSTGANSSAYGIDFHGHLHMHDKEVNYVSQLHFNDGVRFVGMDNNQYLKFKWNNTGSGGIRFYDGDDTHHGYIYGDGNGRFGLLDNNGNWAVRIQTGTDPLQLWCDNNLEFEVYTSYTYSPGSSRAPIFYDSDNTTYYVDPAGTSQIRKTNLTASGSGWDDGLNLYSSDGSNRWNLLVDNGASDSLRIAYNNAERMKFETGGNVITVGAHFSNNSFRAPIFYDSNNTGYYADLASTTTSISLAGRITGNAQQNRIKYSVWSGDVYGIGMKSGFTYGHLGDYAMSFQMNDDNDRGFWWGDSAHSDAQGAMSLTTNGRLTVAESISVGQGASVTSPSTFPLYVDGTAVFDTTSGTEPVCITRSGSTSAEVLKIGVSDRVAQFNYIEDTSSEGTGNFGEYQFILGGNSSETSVTPLKLEKTKTTSNAGAFTFGTPGNGTNTLGRWLSFEGNTDSSGEGSGRLFFSEHNSSTTDMDDYGMSIGYRGGSASVTTAGGNSWTGLTQISNGQWGMWGHNNSLAGSLIMYGDRNATFVNFAGNAINNTGDLNLGTLAGTEQARLFLNGTTANKQAKIQCTNGNLHVDSEDGHSLYLNYYEGTTDNVIIGNGNGGSSGTILKSTGRVNVGEHLIAANNVYSGGNEGFVFGSSTSEGEYIKRNGNNIEFVAYGEIKFDITANGVHVRTGGTYRAQISNTGEGRFAGDVTAYYNFSDKRLKTNIKPTTDNLDKVLKLNPVEYNWKEGYRKDKKEIGLIAQEVEKIIPEVVRENKRLNDDTLYKQVDYEHLVSTLIGAVQEQQKQIDELKAIINGSS